MVTGRGLGVVIAGVSLGLSLHGVALGEVMSASRLGLTFGLDVSKMAYKPDIRLESGETRAARTSIRYGGTIGWSLEPGIDVLMGVSHTGMGEKHRREAAGGAAETEYGFSYITVPALVRLGRRAAVGHVTPFVCLGPEVSVLLCARAKPGTEGVSGVGARDVDIKKYYRDTNWSVLGSVGAEAPVAKSWAASRELGYELGLTDIGKSPVVSELRTRNVYVQLGLAFRLGNE